MLRMGIRAARIFVLFVGLPYVFGALGAAVAGFVFGIPWSLLFVIERDAADWLREKTLIWVLLSGAIPGVVAGLYSAVGKARQGWQAIDRLK
jgi:hypothetical protein